jgi:GNAT superfamily N-acetyltransferase
MAAVDYQLLPSLPPKIQESLHALLLTYNRLNNPVFFANRELPEHASRPLYVVALDSVGYVAGGLMAETQFAWLKVSIMVVADEHQRTGIGRRLLQLAEQEALTRGCRYAYLDTMSYQAPAFYERLGYSVAGKLENWDSHGHTKFFFTKALGD